MRRIKCNSKDYRSSKHREKLLPLKLQKIVDKERIQNSEELFFPPALPSSSACVVASVMSDSFSTLWTITCQAPLSMGFPRQEYWSGLPFPPSGDLPNTGIKPESLSSLALAGRFFTDSATWEGPSSPTPLTPPSRQRFKPFWRARGCYRIMQPTGGKETCQKLA